MDILKAGCYLVDTKAKKIGLIYRDYRQDYTFPKGHLEDGESLKQCAIRETAEETKRDCVIVESIEPTIDAYDTPEGLHCVCYMYVAIDIGKSDNDSLDTHDLIWVDIDNVKQVLSYPSLITNWAMVKDDIIKLINEG